MTAVTAPASAVLGGRRAYLVWLAALSVYMLAVFHRTSLGVAGLLAGGVAHDQQDDGRKDDPDKGRAEECRGPPDAAERGGQRERGRDGAHLPQLAGELRDQRALPLPEPQRHDPDDADEDHRVARADEDSSEHPQLERAHHRE